MPDQTRQQLVFAGAERRDCYGKAGLPVVGREGFAGEPDRGDPAQRADVVAVLQHRHDDTDEGDRGDHEEIRRHRVAVERVEHEQQQPGEQQRDRAEPAVDGQPNPHPVGRRHRLEEHGAGRFADRVPEDVVGGEYAGDQREEHGVDTRERAVQAGRHGDQEHPEGQGHRRGTDPDSTDVAPRDEAGHEHHHDRHRSHEQAEEPGQRILVVERAGRLLVEDVLRDVQQEDGHRLHPHHASAVAVRHDLAGRRRSGRLGIVAPADVVAPQQSTKHDGVEREAQRRDSDEVDGAQRGCQRRGGDPAHDEHDHHPERDGGEQPLGLTDVEHDGGDLPEAQHREDEQEAEPDGHRERHRPAVGNDGPHPEREHADRHRRRQSDERPVDGNPARPRAVRQTDNDDDARVDDVHPRQHRDVVPSEEHGVAGAVEEHEGGAEQERHTHQPTDAVHLVGSHAEQGRHPAAAPFNAPGPIV